ncbi:MAG: hypothetical protein ABI643_03675 [Candidatus Doudnabacteria bacterium]
MPKKVTIDNLAKMIADGFENTTTEITGVKQDIAEVKQDLEDIKLKFDSVAYKFEVKDLDRRVTVLEKENRATK